MHPSRWPFFLADVTRPWSSGSLCLVVLLLMSSWATLVQCMTDDERQALRDETVELFYHGFDNYMEHAFPEDELRPLTCTPLTRDQTNEGHFELNDVLGNYSLTLIDSLSTLAIFASSPATLKRNPLEDFQNGISYLVTLYGDGTDGPEGQGTRSRGFDLDSKVQVFETVIRGVGGLLSAHLFAVGELPMGRYPNPPPSKSDGINIKWANGFTYNGQLLRLALDLAKRLLPAFTTPTGLPYPRVNLKRGIPFYTNSPLNQDAVNGQCPNEQTTSREITETCSAGAGSLVLEFSVLSRLTGDMRFEKLARKAFDAVWERRSSIGLIGAGIDAETGQWMSPYTGIGAGVDSFFEYAVKSHILLSGTSHLTGTDDENHFLSVWEDAHAGIQHHLHRGSAFQHSHYIQGDLWTGASRAFWIDSLSAYYPGLLVLAGELEEAIESHLLYTALWSRYSALPERWNAAGGAIDSGLRWWGGRPEFIESTWYLFQATRDPWYLHVGEMVLKDIKQRCWTECGWAGLEDVRSGELKDRMESFFLGETAKYLFMLFDVDHPLNKLDASFVFTTEGHPLKIPKWARGRAKRGRYEPLDTSVDLQNTCQVVTHQSELGASMIAARPDFFHAASLARLHVTPILGGVNDTQVESGHWDANVARVRESRNGFMWFPWTLPMSLVPQMGMSSTMETESTFDLSFPTLPNTMSGALTLQKVSDGVVVNSVSGLKLSMIREREYYYDEHGAVKQEEVFRIYTVAHYALGRNERVTISPEALSTLNPVDPYFTRHREVSVLDVVVELGEAAEAIEAGVVMEQLKEANGDTKAQKVVKEQSKTVEMPQGSALSNLLEQISSALNQETTVEDVMAVAAMLNQQRASGGARPMLHATVGTGVGAGILPDVADASTKTGQGALPWTSIYVSDETCQGRIAGSVVKRHQVIVMRRGNCTFSEKLRNVPSFAPSSSGLQLVVMVSGEEGGGDESRLIRPALDEVQHTPSGIPRPNPIPVVMVEGGGRTMELLRHAKGIGLRRRYHFSSQGLRIGNLLVV